jgi:hypothetical protein
MAEFDLFEIMRTTRSVRRLTTFRIHCSVEFLSAVPTQRVAATCRCGGSW